MRHHRLGDAPAAPATWLAAAMLAAGCGGGHASPDAATDGSSVVIDAALPDALIEGAYYVAPDGDDDNPGTAELPWRTLAKAAATLVAGDTVYIRSGSYHERLVPENDGAADRPITFRAYPGDPAPEIDGDGVELPDGWGGLVDVDGRSHIVLSRLRVLHAGPDDNHAGILVEDSHFVTVTGCSTYDTVSSGIGVWRSDNVTIEDNRVELACNDGEQECITIAATDQFVVRDNQVLDSGPGTSGGEGIDVKDGSSNGEVVGNTVHDLHRLGIYVDAWDDYTHDIVVHNNWVAECAANGFAVAAENGGLLENVRLYNNVAVHNLNAGLTVAGWGVDGAAHPISGIEIINNTFADNGSDGWGPGIVLENPAADDVVIRNNILCDNGYEQLSVDQIGSGLVVDHNLFQGSGEPYGTDYQVGAPWPADNTDYHPYPDTPAIDTGSPEGAPDDDMQGTARPQLEGFDIGAYEFFW